MPILTSKHIESPRYSSERLQDVDYTHKQKTTFRRRMDEGKIGSMQKAWAVAGLNA